MSCYTRHLGGLMQEMKLEDNKGNRQRLDLALREFLGYAPSDDCPMIWTEVKRYLADPELKKKLLAKVQHIMEVSP
jgi:hypothetical protein